MLVLLIDTSPLLLNKKLKLSNEEQNQSYTFVSLIVQISYFVDDHEGQVDNVTNRVPQVSARR